MLRLRWGLVAERHEETFRKVTGYSIPQLALEALVKSTKLRSQGHILPGVRIGVLPTTYNGWK